MPPSSASPGPGTLSPIPDPLGYSPPDVDHELDHLALVRRGITGFWDNQGHSCHHPAGVVDDRCADGMGPQLIILLGHAITPGADPLELSLENLTACDALRRPWMKLHRVEDLRPLRLRDERKQDLGDGADGEGGGGPDA